ncbi:DUF4040 domain-containing protein [Spiribacter vilamensis]|uniref:DUF4040 domain-containing protein n=1 Tax=Spiribacter vilamensis TaxID=531306 RepID=UPI001EF01744|nr:DUF4040 domain-containing protein [Spiribacter vilamensis]
MLFLIVIAATVVVTRDLLKATMLFAIYSLVIAGFFANLDAGDVALTEAAVGAGIGTVLLLAVLSLVPRYEHRHAGHSLPALVIVTITGAALVYASFDLPAFGQPGNPVHQHLAPYFIEQTYADTGIPNLVAAILASYRSIDTMGEAVVILTAGIVVYALLAAPPRQRRRHGKQDRS